MVDTVNASASLTGAEGAEARDKRSRNRKLAYEAYEEDKRRRRIGEQKARAEAGAGTGTEAGAGAGTGAGAQSQSQSRKKLFSEVPNVVGERVVLNRVVDTDVDALLDLIENPIVQRFLPTYLFEKQFDDVSEAISQLYGDLFQNKESLILAIRDKGTGELAGLAEFYGLRDDLHKISVGYRLRERFWGRGFATEAARLMVGYLYGETDIEIITASTMVENEASARVLEKADFIRTARGVDEDWGFAEPTLVDKWFC